MKIQFAGKARSRPRTSAMRFTRGTLFHFTRTKKCAFWNLTAWASARTRCMESKAFAVSLYQQSQASAEPWPA